jgi:hypothetical protein
MNKNKSVKKSVSKDTSGSKALFCTECGDELDDFSFSEKNRNFHAVMENHKNCVRTGKFSGEFCSKVFISSNMLLDGIWPQED